MQQNVLAEGGVWRRVGGWGQQPGVYVGESEEGESTVMVLVGQHSKISTLQRTDTNDT